MKCSKCGEEVNEKQGFCLKCGNPVQVEPDFNSIENELANSVLEFLEEDDDKVTSLEELTEEEPMKTVDVPYDEINMELKMVDINRNTKKNSIESAVEKSESTKNIKKQQEKPQKKKKAIIILSVIGAALLAALIIGIVYFISDYNSKKTYEGNYDRAYEAVNEANYSEAGEYALAAVKLATSDVEEIAARKLLDEIYRKTNAINDDYASNLKELILLGENTIGNYVSLVKYYYDNEQYSKINEIVITITEDNVFEALSDYIPKAPVAEQESGGYTGYVVVKLSAEEGSKIYYTLNSKDSLNAGVEYKDGVKILGEEKSTLICYAVDENGVESRRAMYEYEISQGELMSPVVTPTSGTYTEFTMISVEVPEGSKAYYTLDGTDPTVESLEYTEPIYMPRGTSKFKVILYDEFDLPSAITTESYNLKIPRSISINDSISLVEAKLVSDEKMDEEKNTVYGTMTVAYDSTAIIGRDEYYIILATEYSSDSSVLSVTIYGVNTFDSSINTDIINAEGEYILPEAAEGEEEITVAE